MPRTTPEADLATGTKMRVTTVRFGRDLWQLLEYEAALAGTSVSQYIREASLARATAAAAARGEDPFESLAAPGAPRPVRTEIEEARRARARALGALEDARALRAQSDQATAEAIRRAERAGRRSKPPPDSGAGDA